MKKISLLLAAVALTASGLAAAAETLPSGVVVDTVTKGTGPSPKASDTVKVHYRGTLTDGTEFDSSLSAAISVQ